MIVVGCGKSKLAHAAPARDLYTGSLFRAARRYAEARGGRWVILSAAHGVIAPELVVRPYDQKLDLRGAALQQWARKAAVAVESLGIEKSEGVELVMGGSYAVAVAQELAELGIASSEPLRSLGMGYRLQWLKRAAEAFECDR